MTVIYQGLNKNKSSKERGFFLVLVKHGNASAFKDFSPKYFTSFMWWKDVMCVCTCGTMMLAFPGRVFVPGHA